LPKFTLQQWKFILLTIVVFDLLIMGGIFYVWLGSDSLAAPAVSSTPQAVAATVIVTPTPWAGPGRRPLPTSTLPPTATATNALAMSGFPIGFTPTPRPTREPVYITLPQIFGVNRGGVDVPIINQIYYPEPFFPPGTNNACGPIALFAGLKGLGLEVDYSHLRDIAVYNGFNAEGISKWGVVNTAATLNNEWGKPLAIEQGNQYRTSDLIKQLRRGAVIIILVRVKHEAGQFKMTDDYYNSFGHFLLVDRINTRAKYVKVAGSTLGMDQVPLEEFIRAWSGETPRSGLLGWSSFLQEEKPDNWALILRRVKK
jgi:hypothetical protein